VCGGVGSSGGWSAQFQIPKDERCAGTAGRSAYRESWLGVHPCHRLQLWRYVTAALVHAKSVSVSPSSTFPPKSVPQQNWYKKKVKNDEKR
jgi:hypothetical protein